MKRKRFGNTGSGVAGNLTSLRSKDMGPLAGPEAKLVRVPGWLRMGARHAAHRRCEPGHVLGGETLSFRALPHNRHGPLSIFSPPTPNRSRFKAAALAQWAECLAYLEEARAIDPAGDDSPAVKKLRAKAVAGIFGKPRAP
jgi:hypothetical protein